MIYLMKTLPFTLIFCGILVLTGLGMLPAQGQGVEILSIEDPKPSPGRSVKSPDAARSATAMVWKLDGPLNTVYICGSIHLLRRTDKIPGAFVTAYRESELVVMEISPEQFAYAAQIQQQPRGLDIPMSPRVKRALREHLLEHGIGRADEIIANISAHQVPALLNKLTLSKEGFSGAYGVEMRFLQLCLRDGKPVEGLETAAEQLSQVAKQQQFSLEKVILESIENSQASTETLIQIVQNWQSGNVEGLEAVLGDGVNARARRFVFNKRNELWIPKIMKHTRKRQNVMIIVGAGHLVGKHSVIDLLKLKGYQFEQL